MFTDMTEGSARVPRRISDRQARVGIVANPKEVEIPRFAQRDIWTRWPNLRSSRRADGAKGEGRGDVPPPDLILSGQALQMYAEELRQSDKLGAAETSAAPSLRDRLGTVGPPEGGRLVLRLALGLLSLAAILVAVSLLQGWL